jgi:hypothetical protein
MFAGRCYQMTSIAIHGAQRVRRAVVIIRVIGGSIRG